jgi:hypothetical protein
MIHSPTQRVRRHYITETYLYRPYRAGLFFGDTPGVKTWLKPQAESFRPFGTKRFAPIRLFAHCPVSLDNFSQTADL